MTMDRLSNREAVFIDDKWIEEATQAFKQALIKQLKPEVRDFGLRMSNLGRPVCTLQREKIGVEGKRDDYNHISRMMFGDAVEIITVLLLKAAQVNITGEKQKHEIVVNHARVPGEDDIWIDNKVYDIKSASSYAFSHKWDSGWNGVYYGDTFGYVTQLWSYAEKDPDKMGGWIVMDKSSGEVRVIVANPTVDQLNEIVVRAEATVTHLEPFHPLVKCFEPEEELFYKKPTGNLLVPMTCTFCKYMDHCWPEALLKDKSQSKAKNPQQKWYVEYTEMKEDK